MNNREQILAALESPQFEALVEGALAKRSSSEDWDYFCENNFRYHGWRERIAGKGKATKRTESRKLRRAAGRLKEVFA